jgi:hypothetical protein
VNQTFPVLVLALVLCAPAGPAAAQEAGSSQKPSAEKPEMIPLKLDLVISRHNGDKKISSLPYSMWVTANAPSGARVRMGVQVPIVQTVFGADSKEKGGTTSVPQQSYTYRNIGTNIDASAMSAPGGRYRVSITLEESGLHEKTNAAIDAPLIRSFNSSFQLLLADKQTATFTSATDPATGETLRVEATLSVLK